MATKARSKKTVFTTRDDSGAEFEAREKRFNDGKNRAMAGKRNPPKKPRTAVSKP